VCGISANEMARIQVQREKYCPGVQGRSGLETDLGVHGI
jgi:hypothetical protein